MSFRKRDLREFVVGDTGLYICDFIDKLRGDVPDSRVNAFDRLHVIETEMPQSYGATLMADVSGRELDNKGFVCVGVDTNARSGWAARSFAACSDGSLLLYSVQWPVRP